MIVILAIGIILFTIREITKYDSRNLSINTTNSRCGHKQDKRRCKESYKCLHNKREV